MKTLDFILNETGNYYKFFSRLLSYLMSILNRSLAPGVSIDRRGPGGRKQRAIRVISVIQVRVESNSKRIEAQTW